ncbi:protein FAR1-RELATED SEQUENCE 5-like [Asparagus officinalis]|uniref:protein FAR1-RELATED SEQUENCE 5-like n=1 Tax=Asparagus officinalis TaxID=4686 RepID=UPI00098E098F|nr:protein FAR1-RELATED SEQUENCE 5-like [Asparagus officinalis]
MEETNSTSVNAPKPLMGMKFNSYEEAYNYYNSYALLMGFGIRKSTVNYSRKTREVVDRKFVCDKEGYEFNKDKMEIHLRRETRVGCKAMMRVKILEDKSWEVTGFVEEHTNHVLSSPDKAKMHRSHQQFHKTQRCKKLIDCLREEELISSVFVFDVTYRTNKFSLPFAPFTGVNQHRQSTLLGCALLADEQEDTFVWLFEEWLKCMHGIEPGAIITDQDRVMCNAIHSVFPTTRYHYYYWHMQKHIIDHLPTLVSRYGEQFQRYWGLWCNSSSIEQCEGYWVEMKEKFDINEEGEGWLQTVYKCREHWVPCYLKDTFFAGMRSSQRSESINAFFDGYVNSQTQLHEFVTQYEKAVTNRRFSEAHEDFKSLNTKPVMLLGHPIESKLEKCIHAICLMCSKLNSKDLVQSFVKN